MGPPRPPPHWINAIVVWSAAMARPSRPRKRKSPHRRNAPMRGKHVRDPTRFPKSVSYPVAYFDWERSRAFDRVILVPFSTNAQPVGMDL